MGEKTAGTGHFQIPTAPAALTAVAQSGSANTLGSAVAFGNAPSAMFITGVTIGVATTQVPTYVMIQILVGASIVGNVLVPYGTSAAAAASVLTGFRPIYPPIPVANGAAITVKSASSVASAVAWGVSLECIAQANVVDDGVAVATVTTVTNQLTAAQIATGVWQDATAGDFSTASSIGKSLYTTGNAPGAASGLQICGSNAATTYATLTVTGATTLTGNVLLSDGLTIAAPSTGNRAGFSIAGNGTGAGMSVTGGATGIGLSVVGGGTSGDGVKVTTTSGHGVNLAPVGTSKHGLFATGGNGGTSDGINAAAGTGGVDLRANQAGNLTGNVSGSVGSVTGLTASNLDATISSRMATYVQPTGFLAATFPLAVASTTNITAAAGVALAANQHVIVDSGTVTTVTNQLTGAQVATAVWTDTTAGDFTTALSVGKSVMNGVTLGTGLTVAAVSGAVGSVAGAVASVSGNVGGNVAGSVGSVVGLTVANLDAAVSSRLATVGYTAPDNSSITAIKAKTDSLSFTVAGRVDSNIRYVNSVAVTGAGTGGSPWGP